MYEILMNGGIKRSLYSIRIRIWNTTGKELRNFTYLRLLICIESQNKKWLNLYHYYDIPYFNIPIRLDTNKINEFGSESFDEGKDK